MLFCTHRIGSFHLLGQDLCPMLMYHFSVSETMSHQAPQFKWIYVFWKSDITSRRILSRVQRNHSGVNLQSHQQGAVLQVLYQGTRRKYPLLEIIQDRFANSWGMLQMDKLTRPHSEVFLLQWRVEYWQQMCSLLRLHWWNYKWINYKEPVEFQYLGDREFNNWQTCSHWVHSLRISK